MKYGTHGYCGKGKRRGSRGNRQGNIVPMTNFAYLFRGAVKSKGEGNRKQRRAAAKAKAVEGNHGVAFN